jgi:hypothetical protein
LSNVGIWNIVQFILWHCICFQRWWIMVLLNIKHCCPFKQQENLGLLGWKLAKFRFYVVHDIKDICSCYTTCESWMQT